MAGEAGGDPRADGEPAAGGGYGLSPGASLTPHTPHLVSPPPKFLRAPEGLPPEPPGSPARTTHSATTRQRSSTCSKPCTGCSPNPWPQHPFRQPAPAAVVDEVGRRPYTDRWYYRVFQSAPDLIRAVLPGSATGANALSLDPTSPGDRLYRFDALEIKGLSHRLDGVLWPRESTSYAETGSPEFPVVLLEVQTHPEQAETWQCR